VRIDTNKDRISGEKYCQIVTQLTDQPESIILVTDLILFYMDSLNKTRSLFYIKVHKAKKALIKRHWSGKHNPFDSPGQR